MSITKDTATPSSVATIEGLERVIDWLRAHPDQPVWFANIELGPISPTREDLVRAAKALGTDATERADRRNVVIEREFAGSVHVRISSTIERLGGRAIPAYEPIIPDPLDAPVGEGRR